jgi:hypothetical protein
MVYLTNFVTVLKGSTKVAGRNSCLWCEKVKENFLLSCRSFGCKIKYRNKTFTWMEDRPHCSTWKYGINF